MFSDSASNPLFHSPPNAKNLSKKKRANKNAKLKQCKLDARREQWLSLSQSKSKGCKEDESGAQAKAIHLSCDSESSRGGVEEPISQDYQESDCEWPRIRNSPSFLIESVLSCSDESQVDSIGSRSSRGESESVNEEGGERDDDDYDNEDLLDDWESIADALAADDKQTAPPGLEESIIGIDSSLGLVGSKPEINRMVSGKERNNRAWQPDDTFRPHSLPDLSKQLTFPNPNSRHCWGDFVFAKSVPSCCPICYEELDCTDTRFIPCFCGFRLCLFCHKRILEEDGRCPGCRNPYKKNYVATEASIDGSSFTSLLARSSSMIARSSDGFSFS